MAMVFKYILIASLSMLMSSWTYAASPVRLTNGEWPPYLSEKLAHYGFASHIVSEALKKNGMEVEWGFFPWKRAFIVAENGQWDGSVIWTHNEEREKNFIFSEPVVEGKDVVFHRKDKPIQWEKITDLAPYSIGATTGYFYGEEFDKAEKAGQITVNRTAKESNNFKKLIANRIDLVVASIDVGYEIMQGELTKEEMSQITHHPKATRMVSYHLIVSRKSKNAQAIIDAFNAGLKQLKDSGELAKMIQNSQQGKYKK